VRAIQGDSVLLADGRVIPADYRTFTHGYAVTSHAAQGKTVDEVLVVASSRSLPAINQEQFYVSISRGRERCQIFTDDATCFVRTSPIPVHGWRRLRPCRNVTSSKPFCSGAIVS
jgi:hypothetical protein